MCIDLVMHDVATLNLSRPTGNDASKSVSQSGVLCIASQTVAASCNIITYWSNSVSVGNNEKAICLIGTC